MAEQSEAEVASDACGALFGRDRREAAGGARRKEGEDPSGVRLDDLEHRAGELGSPPDVSGETPCEWQIPDLIIFVWPGTFKMSKA